MTQNNESSDMNRQALIEHHQKLIATHGVALTYVSPTEEDLQKNPNLLPFAYTSGLSLYGLPEFVVSGLPAEASSIVLTCLSKSMIARPATWHVIEPLPEDQILDHDNRNTGLNIPVYLRAVGPAHLAETTSMTRAALRGAPDRVQQVLVPDQHGLWPWETGCELDQTIMSADPIP